MKKTLLILLCSHWALGQMTYTAQNAHSHNDYEQAQPFHLAYSQGFGSIEADVFLRNDSLFVAHEYKEIQSDRTLESLYLRPILAVLKKNKGIIYPNYPLQLLIDLKTDYHSTLPVLETVLKPVQEHLYPEGSVKIVISGSLPPPEDFKQYASFIYFDGRPEISYTEEELERVALISQNAWKYSLWDKAGLSLQPDKLKEIVKQVHALGKPIRLWATPDKENTWKLLKSLEVDFINTDRIMDLANYLNN